MLGFRTSTRKQYPPSARSELVNVPCLPPSTVRAPTVMNCEPAGAPAVSLVWGATAFRLQFRPVAVPPRVARWTLYEMVPLVVGAVKLIRTSSAVLPLSKLPVAAVALLGASAPALFQISN